MIRKLTTTLALLLVASASHAVCIPSGTVDQYAYFVAVDSTDFTTRETGLSSFTVYRSRNGAAAVLMTDTVNETDVTNMPGVYELLLDEDMTIGSGNDEEEMTFHITHAGMAPITRAIQLCRPTVTGGETLTVASGVGESLMQGTATGAITATSINANAIGASEIATDAIGADELATSATDEIWATQCEDQNGGYSCAEVMSVLLSEAVGTCTYTTGTRTWVCEDPGGLETRFTIIYNSALDGGRDTSTPAPFTP